MNNSRIEKEYIIQAATYFENDFSLNLYDLKLYMLVVTDDIREQGIAVDRLNYFLTEKLESCIFISKSHTELIKKYEEAKLNVSVLPEEPYDQIVGMVLLMKLNSILENKIQILDITIGSKFSSGIKFNISNEEAELYYAGNFWFNDSSPSIKELVNTEKKEKVVKLFKDEWDALGLSWKEKLSKKKP